MSTHHTPTTFSPVAGLAALILPGAGHFVLGQRGRAAAIAAGVLGLFFGGLLIGGIDVVDSREDRLWFIGQALIGPVAFGVDYAHQTHFKGVYIPPEILVNKKISSRQLALLTRSPRSAGPGEVREVMTLQVVDPHQGQAASVTIPVLRRLTAQEFASAGLSPELDENQAPLTRAEMSALDAKGLGPPNRKSLSKVNELGTLFATIAGMLNIIVILDALFPPIRTPGTSPGTSPGIPETAPGAAA
ncbi:MAG: hypothetical protein IT436_00620 [Phycisphaerales bacterium]|nr:hypothetical protein [Phycisphaerales bacterium]